jgi:DNA-binding HxlR family transcriptional regulator
VDTNQHELWESAEGLLSTVTCLRHKWAIEALWVLHASGDSQRLGEMLRVVGRLDDTGTVWPNTLRKTLDHLHSHGLVGRQPESSSDSTDQVASYVYSLSDLGQELVEQLQPLGRWARHRWPRELDSAGDRG